MEKIADGGGVRVPREHILDGGGPLLPDVTVFDGGGVAPTPEFLEEDPDHE